MKDNPFNLTLFERICLLLNKVFKIVLFIYSIQYGFITENSNIYIFIATKVFCVVCIGSYLANYKINEKLGHLMEKEKNR